MSESSNNPDPNSIHQADEAQGEQTSSSSLSSTSSVSTQGGPIAWMTKNSVAANVIMFVLLVGGLAMLTQVKQEVFPEIELDKIIINVLYPGASPEEVEQGVVLAVEEAVRSLDGVKEVRSTSSEGVGAVFVDLLLGTDTDRALSDVKSAVDRITSFPQDAERPVISLATNRRQVITLVYYGDVDEKSLRNLVESARYDLLQRDGITYVEVSGVRPLEISVEISQANLRKYGLTLEQVAQIIRQNALELPAGGVRTEAGEILLRTTERKDVGKEFERIPLLSLPNGVQVHLGDVATIRDDFQETDESTYFNGKRAAMVQVYRVGNETPIAVSDVTRAYMEEAKQKMPPGVEIAAWADSSEIYADRINLLKKNAILGLILVLLILGMFLEPKLGFWVTLGIPISFLGAILFMPALDASINMISLFAFIVTLGMVVDDAIVVGEAIYKKRQEGLPFSRAAVEGAREVATPVIFSILTTCVAFSPLLFVPGTMGKFFRVIPIIVISVLLMSLLESLTVLPAHLAHTMPRSLKLILTPWFLLMKLLRADKVGAWLERFIENVYQPSIKKAVKWRYLTFAISIAMLLIMVGFIGGGRIKFTFLPKIDGDVVMAKLSMPVGTSVDETQKVLDRMISMAKQTLEENGGEAKISRGILSMLGSSDTPGMRDPGRSGLFSSGSHLATAMVYMVPNDERGDLSASQFAKQWREAVGEIAGMDTLSFSYSIGATSGEPINIRLSHPNPEVLEQAAARLAKELENYEGVRDIDDGYDLGKEQYDFKVRSTARAFGVSTSSLARQIRSAFYGAEALRQQRGRDELRVFVRLPRKERENLFTLEELLVRTPEGGEIPLEEAAIIQKGRAYTRIRRTDGRRTADVTADIVPGVANATQVTQSLQEKELPQLMADFQGLTYELAGQQKEQAEAFQSLLIGFLLALMVMFGMLAIAFKSYMQPLIVLSAIPFGMVGAWLGHVLMGYDLSIMSMMGVVALGGVVVNDSLIFVVAINEYRKTMPLFDAIVAGGMRRFRPILLTSLTTFFGLAPMILETSVQARFLIPMAISLGFGVLFATFIILLLVPSLYLILEDGLSLFGRKKEG